ncbi:hypothetical protein GFB56_22325 [Ensifer sp. T173]|uniref:Uncharacterized protein n=1 Tax=Ensifer canadensis TaxID=555315 RepID=A0AAW4FQ92_9HYPH|nr:hypothetical protein [Ensifer canadensis]MBM3093507.1 hypothetical protein [Ensifer canadensis]UBI79310.1 hypothetical protein J3R84_19895 [Ensifer canadensis]
MKNGFGRDLIVAWDTIHTRLIDGAERSGGNFRNGDKLVKVVTEDKQPFGSGPIIGGIIFPVERLATVHGGGAKPAIRYVAPVCWAASRVFGRWRVAA